MPELLRYHDEFAATDFGEEFGRYLVSCATDDHLVEVHLFRAPEGDVVVYVTKSPGVPLTEVRGAVRNEVARYVSEADLAGHPVRYVYDPSGLATSGSL